MISLQGIITGKRSLHRDDRGYFSELAKLDANENGGIQASFVQDNLSLSKKGVVRGLHFQHPPMAQGKWVHVLSGEIFDVVVDIRKHSKTYGKAQTFHLDSQNGDWIYVPTGFAHGFQALQDETMVFYKCTNFYSAPHEDGLLFTDPDLDINWPLPIVNLSPKDILLQKISTFVSPF